MTFAYVRKFLLMFISSRNKNINSAGLVSDLTLLSVEKHQNSVEHVIINFSWYRKVLLPVQRHEDI